MATYAEKLKDPRWQKKRLEILQLYNFQCGQCFDGSSTLHIHHHKYSGNPWDSEKKDLVALCDDCHFVVSKCNIDLREFILQNIKIKVADNKKIIIYRHQKGGMFFLKNGIDQMVFLGDINENQLTDLLITLQDWIHV